jgi:hypothetical protein
MAQIYFVCDFAASAALAASSGLITSILAPFLSSSAEGTPDDVTGQG